MSGQQKEQPTTNGQTSADADLHSFIHQVHAVRNRLGGSLPHSPAGLRYHYARLMEDGWINTEPHGEDGRVRLVKPTDRLIESYRNIFASCLAEG